jgi:ParB family transcriptional regulator, chromosome partitioning protein
MAPGGNESYKRAHAETRADGRDGLSEAAGMKLEFHQLDRRLEHLRVCRPERHRRLLASLDDSGQQVPIVTVEVENQPHRYLVIDGYKRVAALQQLGRDTVEATVWEMSEGEALVLDRSMRLSEKETSIEQGWVLAELEQRFGYTIEDLARRFDRSASWVSRRLALVELLPGSVQQKVRAGAVSAHVAMKCLVPVARVSLDDCERMAAAFATHRFNTRQASQIYAAWRDAPQSVRRRILDEPRLFLKTQKQPTAPPAPDATELLRDLDMVVAIANRAGRRFARAGPMMDSAQLEDARQKIGRALNELTHLSQRIEREQQHVEHTAAGSDSGTARSGNQETGDRPDVRSVPHGGEPGSAVAIGGVALRRSCRESVTVPEPNPGTLLQLQGEPGPGP